MSRHVLCISTSYQVLLYLFIIHSLRILDLSSLIIYSIIIKYLKIVYLCLINFFPIFISTIDLHKLKLFVEYNVALNLTWFYVTWSTNTQSPFKKDKIYDNFSSFLLDICLLSLSRCSLSKNRLYREKHSIFHHIRWRHQIRK